MRQEWGDQHDAALGASDSSTIPLALGVSGFGQATEADPEPHLVINEIEINPAGLDTDHE